MPLSGMDSSRVKELVISSGATAAGIATAGRVDDSDREIFSHWIESGHHAGMAYMEKHEEVRNNTRLLLDGAESVIVAAFRYGKLNDETRHAENSTPNGVDETRHAASLHWARYAVGRDYHEVVRERLGLVAGEITRITGATCRVAVDTAPMRERYWAVRAGIGFTGMNGQLIVPGAGSMVVIGSIITTLRLEPDMPCTQGCLKCGKCIKACPGNALDGYGGVDARRCLSYLTIESRDDDALAGIAGKWVRDSGRIYGCDVCQEVCPYNLSTRADAPGWVASSGADAPGCIPTGGTNSVLDDFKARPDILALTREDILAMDQPTFSRIFSHSAIKRAKLSGLRRNAGADGISPSGFQHNAQGEEGESSEA